jgi:hypothetical protein
MFGELKNIVKIFLTKLLCYHDNYFKFFMFAENTMVSSARRGVSPCMYFLVIIFILGIHSLTLRAKNQSMGLYRNWKYTQHFCEMPYLEKKNK